MAASKFSGMVIGATVIALALALLSSTAAAASVFSVGPGLTKRHDGPASAVHYFQGDTWWVDALEVVRLEGRSLTAPFARTFPLILLPQLPWLFLRWRLLVRNVTTRRSMIS